MKNGDDSLMRYAEVADLIGISPRLIHNWVRTGRIPYLKLGRSVRFDRAEVLKFLASQRVSPNRNELTAYRSTQPNSQSPIPCKGHWSHTVDGNDFDCEYPHAGAFGCDDCIVNGGRYDPRTGKKSGKILLRIPRSLHHQAVGLADAEGVSLNTFLVAAIAAKVGSLEPQEKAPEESESRLQDVQALEGKRGEQMGQADGQTRRPQKAVRDRPPPTPKPSHGMKR